jgi:glycosyltransferase involved in cell wall biosynthesis
VEPLSAVLIVQDEEELLPAALDSVAFCDEVVVVDSGSTDKTCEIARAKGARVVVNTPWPGFVGQRNFATEQASHHWILAVDADERVTPGLRAEIEAERAHGFARAGYRIPRVAHYLGRWIRGTDWYPDPQLRLFDRRRGRWQGKLVHESVRVEGSVGRLRNDMEHLSYRDLSHHLRTIDSYTTLWAEQAFEAGRRAGVVQAAGACAWAFVRNYLLKGGYRLGATGLTVSTLNSYYAFLKLAKLGELERNGGPRR